MIRYPLPSYQTYSDNLAELDGFWEVVKSLPGEIGGLIKKIDPEQVLKAGEIIAKFKEGKRGKRDVIVEYFPKGRGDVGGLGISTTTLILVAGGAGLLVYLLVRGQK